MYVLNENNLIHMLLGYCADNTNSNFGAAHRKITNIVLSRINSNPNQPIIGV